jgi:hypothetical protein
VDSEDYVSKLRALEPEAIGGEMEGGGMYVSCHEKKTDWILVKGICDWASNKAEDKEARQILAAKNAAEFVYHALTFSDEVVDGETEESADRTPSAVDLLKQYLGDAKPIAVFDLVKRHLDAFVSATNKEELPFVFPEGADYDAYLKERATAYETAAEALLSIYANLCAWARPESMDTIIRVVERLGTLPNPVGVHNPILHRFQVYPALLMIYAGGIGALSKGRWDVLANLFARPMTPRYGYTVKASSALYPDYILEYSHQKKVFGDLFVPMNDHLYQVLQETFRPMLTDDEYESLFNQFDFLYCLVVSYYLSEEGYKGAVPGRYVWIQPAEVEAIINSIKVVAGTHGTNWPCSPRRFLANLTAGWLE